MRVSVLYTTRGATIDNLRVILSRDEAARAYTKWYKKRGCLTSEEIGRYKQDNDVCLYIRSIEVE